MYGIDAVLLADFAAPFIHNKDSLIDLGCGDGIIPLLLSTLTKAQKIAGLEIQKASAQLAEKGVMANGLENRISIVNGDMKNVAELFNKHSFNVVCSNPPYMYLEQGKTNPDSAKAIARHEVMCNLDDVIKAADYLLATHGRFFMIHRPSRLHEIMLALMKYKLQPKRIQLVFPDDEKNANLVLIEARKNAGLELKVEKSVYVYSAKNEYSPQIQAVFERLKASAL